MLIQGNLLDFILFTCYLFKFRTTKTTMLCRMLSWCCYTIWRCKIKRVWNVDSLCLKLSLHKMITISPGPHGDIFTPSCKKTLTQNLKSLPRGNQFLLCQLGYLRAPLGFWPQSRIRLGFNISHKVDTYNLIMGYAMVIQTIKHCSWQRYLGPNLNQLTPKLPQKGL